MQYVLRWKGLVERSPVAQFAVSSCTCGRVPNAIPGYSFNSELIPIFCQIFFVRRRRLALTAELCSRYWDELIVAVSRSKFSHKELDIFLEARLISNFRPEFFCLRSTQYVLRWKGLVERYPVTQFAGSSGTCGRSPQCNSSLQL